MQVILLERIEKLGQMGDVVNVKPGYARNYLLPEKKALRATDENRRYFEKQRSQLEAVNLERRQEAEAVAAKMQAVSVTLIRQAGEAGQLYGSVGARDIADAMTAAGFAVSRKQVKLAPPIKTVGVHDVRVDLHAEVAITVKANVARSPEEADIQAKTGEAVVRAEADQRPALLAEEEVADSEDAPAPEAEGSADEDNA
ncbi:MAG: 50S ribosomal protein L9 [Rhodospirillales bacterium]|nr:50S ribosomal protein L9 [Rhodospirillales bacterium]